MLCIRLNNLRFFSFHGLYEEEKILGNEFEVNVFLEYLPQNSMINNLEETVNYASVFDLIKEQMSIPTPLLETLVMQIAQKIMHDFSLVQKIEIAIKKLHPPIMNFEGNVAVSYLLERRKNTV